MRPPAPQWATSAPPKLVPHRGEPEHCAASASGPWPPSQWRPRDSFTNRVILCALSGIPDNAHHPGRGVIRGGAAAVLLGAWIDAAGSRIIGVLSA